MTRVIVHRDVAAMISIVESVREQNTPSGEMLVQVQLCSLLFRSTVGYKSFTVEFGRDGSMGERSMKPGFGVVGRVAVFDSCPGY